jgi:hypothetical protein
MSTSSITQVISLMVAPVVLISAAAMLLGSIYVRLAACISRTRSFDSKIQSILEKKIKNTSATSMVSDLYTRQIRSIRNQGQSILSRAKKLQSAIYMFEITVISMIVTGMMAALSLVNEATFVPLTLVTMIMGMLFLLGGVYFSMKEALETLGPVETEFLQVVELSLEEDLFFVDSKDHVSLSPTDRHTIHHE